VDFASGSGLGVPDGGGGVVVGGACMVGAVGGSAVALSGMLEAVACVAARGG
jgi:hypothetical protein